MTNNEKIELSKFVIGRYDHYFDSVNNKANFWLAFNTFAIGVVLTTYKDVKDIIPVHATSWFNWGVVVFLVVAVVASFLILVASWPHLNTRKRAAASSRSLLYFDDVAVVDIVDYQNALDGANEHQLQLDYTNQVHQLATGLSRKYQLLAIAGRLMAGGLGVFLYLIVVVVVGNFFNK